MNTTRVKTPCEMYSKPSPIQISLTNSTKCTICDCDQFSHKETFHVTYVTMTDPNSKADVTLNAGDVIRFDSMSKSAFNDAVILGFSPQGYVKLSRPYVYASMTGTTCVSPLLGCETFNARIDSIIEFDARIDTGRICK